MGRVKIKFPEQNPVAKVTIPVRIGDINYGGHVGNDAVLSIIHEARMQMLSTWNYTELDAGGDALIMADVMIAYRGEAFYGDVLDVKIYVEDITTMTFDLLYHITTVRNGERKEIAHAKTTMVCFDYKNRQKDTLKEELKKRLQGL